jgi:hypothetical protein
MKRSKRPPKQKGSGKGGIVPGSAEEAESRAMDEVTTLLSCFTTDFASRVAATEQFGDYFPGANEVPEGGAWILVKREIPCAITVPPLSLWFAEPWPMAGRHRVHRVKIITPRGELGVFPHEYSRVADVAKYYEFLGAGMEIRFFGGELQGLPELPLFYLRSRGISKRDALAMLVGHIKAHGVCWIESTPETCAAFGMAWPHASRLATVGEKEAGL